MAGALQSDTVRFGSTDIAYSIRRSRERNTIGISVCGPWVEVAAPLGMRAAAIRPHVERKGAWILQKLELARRHAPIYPKVLRAGDSIRFFGRQFLLRIHPQESARSRVEMNARQFHLHLPPEAAPDAGHKAFKRLFRRELETRLPEWIGEYAGKLGVETPPFYVRELGNRWGSCTASGTLQFHWLLATQSSSFIRQVVAHELCHLIEPKHSKGFFQLLKRVMPEVNTGH